MHARSSENNNNLIAQWQEQLPRCKLVLGGSLVSGLFVRDEEAKVYDVDLRFLTDNPTSPELIAQVEAVTGLMYKKTIDVKDWPSGQSKGIMVEGARNMGLDLPLEVEGCIRNPKYVGWARLYPIVFTQEELAEFRKQKLALRHDRDAYKRFKQNILTLAKQRCIERGLV